jgi:hypothetical protein
MQTATDQTPQREPPDPLSQATVLLRSFRATPFENQAARLSLDDEGKLCITSSPTSDTFQAMLTRRKFEETQNHTPSKLIAEMRSIPGMSVSNIGVSVALTTLFNGKRYLIAVSQKRPDFNDTVLKLISGYVNAIPSPSKEHEDFGAKLVGAGITELGEEFVPWTTDSKSGSRVLRGLLSGAHDLIARELLIHHKDATHGSKIASAALPAHPQNLLLPPAHGLFAYDPALRFTINPSSNPLALKSLNSTSPVMIDGIPYQLGMYISSVFKSAQAVLQYEIELPKIPGLSISAAEHTPHPTKSGVLVEQYRRDGAALLELDSDGNLTRNAFRLYKGELIKLDDITLSEAFLPSVMKNGQRTGIVVAKNVKMNDCVSCSGDGADIEI